MPYHQTNFGAEAASELIDAMEAFSGEYGEQYAKLSDRLPEERREERKFNMDIYQRIGRALIPLHDRSKKLTRKSKAGAGKRRGN
jgi:hypothetical protein